MVQGICCGKFRQGSLAYGSATLAPFKHALREYKLDLKAKGVTIKTVMDLRETMMMLLVELTQATAVLKRYEIVFPTSNSSDKQQDKPKSDSLKSGGGGKVVQPIKSTYTDEKKTAYKLKRREGTLRAQLNALEQAKKGLLLPSM